MSTLARYLRLPSDRKRHLHAALGWLILFRIGLMLVPLRTLQRLSPKISNKRSGAASLEALRWALLAAARRLPGTRCLPRALALQAMMAREGLPSQLCIGVAKEPASPLEAHAWVVHAGVPVFDEPDLPRYRLLSVFPAEA
jgi:Transglutaminase-like superfamily